MTYSIDNKPSTKTSIALLATIFGIYMLLSPAHFLTSPDEELNLRTTLSLLQGHYGAIPSLEGFASKTGKNGQEYAQYGLGLPIASLPWCALGVIIDQSENHDQLNQMAFFFDKTTDPVGTAFLRAWMTIFSMLISALTIILFYRIIFQLGLSETNAIFASLLLAFCTYLWPHGRTFFTEPLVAFCLMAALACLINAEHNSKYLWTLCAGLFWAYAVLTRLDSLITAPAAAWLLLFQRNQKFTINIDIKKITLFAIPWIGVISIILLYNTHRFGAPFSTGYEDQPENIQFLTPILVGLQGFLFTPGRSIFIYSPPLILALFGIIRFWNKDNWLAGGVFLIIVGYLGVMSKWQNWAGGFDWGPRHIYQITPFLMIPAALWIGKRPLFDSTPKRIGWFALIAISLFIQFIGLSADPVMIIKMFLYRTLRPFPENLHAHLTMYMQQLPVYLPQFSNISLHWQWVASYGADLMIIKTLSDNIKNIYLFLIPFGIAFSGGYSIKRIIAIDPKTNIN
jgi:dolichyl-phosphate-mannose-protein mannosyltransferase